MAQDELKRALQQIVDGATAALAALPGEDADEQVETVAAVVVPEHDYHAEELERIDAQTAADVAKIEATAAAEVAIIQAQGEAIADRVADFVADPIETTDELVDAAIDDNPVMDETIMPADEPGDLDDAGEAVEDAGDLLDSLPVLEPEQLGVDMPPTPADWYRRRRKLRR
jgi:hypothetical protein